MYNSKNKEGYEKLLLNLNLLKKYRINKLQILNYYIKRNYLYVDWMVAKLNKTLDINDKIIKKYYEPPFYNKWQKMLTTEKLEQIDRAISNFFNKKSGVNLINNIK